VEAHSKGAMSAMAAHPYSPLLATATATQVTHSCQQCTKCFSKITLQIGCSDECCSWSTFKPLAQGTQEGQHDFVAWAYQHSDSMFK